MESMATYRELNDLYPTLTVRPPAGTSADDIILSRHAAYTLLDEGWTLVAGVAFDYHPRSASSGDGFVPLPGLAADGKVLKADETGAYSWQHERGAGGYEYTGGFVDGAAGILYTSTERAADQWLRLGLSDSARQTNDVVYWTDPDSANDPNYDGTKGLFGGLHNPAGVDRLIDFTFSDTGYSSAVTGQSVNYTAADGSLDFTTCRVGDKLEARLDMEITLSTNNTLVEYTLIWQTRDAQGNPTFTFPLTGGPLFFGVGTGSETHLVRPTVTAYFASNEDLRAKALFAIKADKDITVKPISTLVAIQR